MTKSNIESIFDLLYSNALNGSCLHRKYAALLVNHDNILSVGYATTVNGDKCNTCPRNEHIRKYGKISEFFEQCPVIHAEICAILNCKMPDQIQGSDLYLLGILGDNQSIYREAFPCENCMKVIRYVGIRKIKVFQTKKSLIFYEV